MPKNDLDKVNPACIIIIIAAPASIAPNNDFKYLIAFEFAPPSNALAAAIGASAILQPTSSALEIAPM